MRDLYLRFPDEDTATPLLYDGDGEDQRPRFRALDVLGVLYTDADPPVPLDGWHVNVRAYPDEDVSALLPYEVQPEHPRRTWAPMEAPPSVPPYVPPLASDDQTIDDAPVVDEPA